MQVQYDVDLIFLGDAQQDFLIAIRQALAELRIYG